MITVNVSTLKNKLSAYLRRVREGEDVLVMDRDRPVARLMAVGQPPPGSGDKVLFRELISRGIIEVPKKKKVSTRWIEDHLFRPPRGASALKELLDERDEAPR